MCHAKCESSQASAAIVIHNPGHPVESARNARAVILQRFGNLTNQKYGLGYVTCLYSGSLVLLIIQAPIFRIPGHFAGPMHEPRPRSQNPGAKKGSHRIVSQKSSPELHSTVATLCTPKTFSDRAVGTWNVSIIVTCTARGYGVRDFTSQSLTHMQ